jgi:hypothetical protein
LAVGILHPKQTSRAHEGSLAGELPNCFRKLVALTTSGEEVGSQPFVFLLKLPTFVLKKLQSFMLSR